MTSLLHWLTSPEWAQVVKALLHSLWQGALVAAALSLLLRRFTDPKRRYRLSLAGLGMVVLSAIVTWGVLSAPEVSTPEFVASAEPFIEVPTFAEEPTEKVVVTANWTATQPQVQWTAWIALAWLLGASAMLGRASVKVAGAERLRRSCRPLSDPRIAELVKKARQAVGLARQVRVAVTNHLTSPAVVGVLVPTLILPLSLVTTLSHEQIRFILLHELAHIRRGDYLANLFQLLAEALLFFNPAVWWISHQVRREREACCDALAIELSGAPADYAHTLVSVAETMLDPTPTAAPAFGGEGGQSSLADRVQRLLVPGYRPSLRLTWRAILAALMLGGLMLGLLAFGARNTVAAALGSGAAPESLPLDPESVDFPYVNINLQPDFVQVEDTKLRQLLPEADNPYQPWVLRADELDRLQRLLLRVGAQPFHTAESMTEQIVSGMRCRWRVGATDNRIKYLVEDVVDEKTTNKRVAGMDSDLLADAPGWVPMEFSMVPRVQTDGILCDMKLIVGEVSRFARLRIPSGGGMVWATPLGATAAGFRQLVVLRHQPQVEDEASRIAGNGVSENPVTPNPDGSLDVAVGLAPRTTKATNTESGFLFSSTNGPSWRGPGVRPSLIQVRADGSYWNGSTPLTLDEIRKGLRTFPRGTSLRIEADDEAPAEALIALNRVRAEVGLAEEIGMSDLSPIKGDFHLRSLDLHSLGFLESARKRIGQPSGYPAQQTLVKLWRALGVAPRSFTLSWDNERLLIRATEEDLAAIEQFIQSAPASKESAVTLTDRARMVAAPVPIVLSSQTSSSRSSLTAVADSGFESAPNTATTAITVPGLSFDTLPGQARLSPGHRFEGHDQPVIVHKDGSYEWLNSHWEWSGLSNQIVSIGRSVGDGMTNRTVRIQADEDAPFQAVVRLVDLLKLIGAKSAAEISKAQPQTEAELYTRTFRCDPALLEAELVRAGIRVPGPVTPENGEPPEASPWLEIPENDRSPWIAWFKDMGVEMAPPKFCWWKDRLGWLHIRATAEDLNRIGQYLARLEGSQQIYSRTFKLAPNTFAKALDAVGLGSETNLSEAVRQLFAKVGVNLEPPEAAFYNDRVGQLWVRASLDELDAIESLIEVLNQQPPQVNVRARFVEMPQADFDEIIRQFNSATNQLRSFTGILTEPQAKALLQALADKTGVDILSAPEVTTLSGRQAQIQVVDIQSVVTGVVPMVTNGISTNVFQVSQLPFGPVLDVVPYVSSDGHTIQMAIIPSVTAFIGYDDPGEFRTGNRWGVGVPVDPLPLPRFRLRQLTTSATVWDGQTIVLGGFISETVTRHPDGRQSTNSTPALDKKQLLVFVTPTIVDPAGNRVHSPDEIPFDPEAIPPQR